MKTFKLYAALSLTLLLAISAFPQEHSQPMITPADCNHILISYRLDGGSQIFIYFGNGKADKVTPPDIDLNKLNSRRLGNDWDMLVMNHLVDLLNKYDKEGFDLISSSSYEPSNPAGKWTIAQYVLKKRK
ncbi:MAG: hypothetical protein HOP30_16635 [Cyclobacteriaceae bacterium]|nr:hypothetical protein [Cyclobacteriaceae bacterium]